MPSKSNIDLVILALIAEEPIHGYDLVKRSDDDKIADWADLPTSSVYNALKDLEAKEYIKAKEVRIGKKPPRAVYHITGSGRNALIAGLLRLLTEPFDPRDDFAIALMGAESIPRERVIQAIEIHRDQAIAKFNELQSYLETNRESMTLAYRSIYTRLVEMYRTHIKWLESFETEIKNL